MFGKGLKCRRVSKTTTWADGAMYKEVFSLFVSYLCCCKSINCILFVLFLPTAKPTFARFFVMIVVAPGRIVSGLTRDGTKKTGQMTLFIKGEMANL